MNMRISYLTYKLSDEQLQNLWHVLQSIKDSLDYKEPLDTISVSLHQENCKISPAKVYDILEYLQWKGILTIVKKANKSLENLQVVSVKILRKKFDKEYDEVKTEIEKRHKKSRGLDSIHEIICVRPASGDKFLLVINGNYQHIIKGDQGKRSWNLLFEVAEGKEIWYNEESHKNDLDYFNSNKKNRLYTQTGYKITKILKVEGGLIKPNIKMSVISQKAFQRRLKKAEK